MFITQTIRPTFALIIVILKAMRVSKFLQQLKILLKNQLFQTNVPYYMGKYLVYAFLLVYTIVFWYFTEYRAADQIFFYLNKMVPFILDFFIIALLSVIKKCFQNINIEVRKLTKNFEKGKLQTIMLLHWNLNDLVEEVDGNFAMIILVGLVCTVMEVILLLFYFIETTSRGNVVIRNIIQDIVLLTRIVLLCKAGSDIVQQVLN